MPRAASAAASVWYTLFPALDRLAAEEELRPQAIPLLPFVERDRRVDDLVRELVEWRIDGQAGGHAVHALEELLAFAREQELGEEERRMRPARILRHADGARLAEGGRERLPVDRRAGLLKRLHVVVIGVNEKRDLARGDELRAEDVAAPYLRLHRREPPEKGEALLLAHRLHERGEPQHIGRFDRQAPGPAWLQQLFVARRQLLALHQARVVAEHEEGEARRNVLPVIGRERRRRELAEGGRVEVFQQLLAAQRLHAVRARLEDIRPVVAAPRLGERALHDLFRRAAPVHELHAVALLKSSCQRPAVLHGHRAVENDLSLLLRAGDKTRLAIGAPVHIDVAIGAGGANGY